MGRSAQPVDLNACVPSAVDDDQRLTVDGTTGGVQASAFDPRTTHVFWTLEDAQIRFTLDGSAPTSANGHILEVGDFGIWPMSWVHAAKFIRTGATSGILHLSPLIQA